AQGFDAQAQIEREVLARFPVVLNEEAEVVRAVFVVINAAAAETEVRSAQQEFLPIGELRGVGRAEQGAVHEKELAVKDLREEFVEIDARRFTAEAEYVGAFDPTHGVGEVEGVLVLELIGRGRGTDLEAGAAEGELVDGGGDAIGRAIDAEVGGG